MNSMAIDFSNCGIRESQIKTLTDALARKCGKLHVTSLILCDNKLTDKSVTDLFCRASAAFPLLKNLNLGNNKLGPVSISSITAALTNSQSFCDKLSVLDLSRNSLKVSNLLTLIGSGSLANLKWLCLHKTFTSDADVSDELLTNFLNTLLAHCYCLELLDLSGNKFQISVPGASILAKMISRHCKVLLLVLRPHSTIVDIHHPIDKLQLSLSATNLSDKGLSAFIESLEGSCHFTRLELEGNAIHATGVLCLADAICSGKIVIQSTFHLEEVMYDDDDDDEYSTYQAEIFIEKEMEYVNLHLDGNPLGLEGTEAIIRMLSSGLCQPKMLSLSNCQLTTATAGGDLPNTDYLNLENIATNEIIREVGQQMALCNCNTITHLCLDANSFTGGGIHILAGYISLCPTLTVLSSDQCEITSEDLKQLLDKLVQLKSSSPNLCSGLMAWHLNNNEIDDSGVLTLITHLRIPSLFPYSTWSIDIHLLSNPVSSVMMTRLKKELNRRQEVSELHALCGHVGS